MADLSGYSVDELQQMQQQLPPTPVTPPAKTDLSGYSDEQLRQMQQQLPSPQSGPVAAAQGWYGQINAALQGTSPVVRDTQGRLNYNRLGDPITTDAGPGYIDSSGKWQLVEPTRHVMLNDPMTGQMGVFERNQATDESRLTSLGRLASFGVQSGVPGRLVPAAEGGALARAVGSPVTKTAANALTGGATGLLAARLGLPEEISGLLGMALGFGPHATGGGLGGEAMQKIAGFLASRVPPNPVPIMRPGTAAIPGLLNSVTGDVAGQPPYGYLP